MKKILIFLVLLTFMGKPEDIGGRFGGVNIGADQNDHIATDTCPGSVVLKGIIDKGGNLVDTIHWNDTFAIASDSFKCVIPDDSVFLGDTELVIFDTTDTAWWSICPHVPEGMYTIVLTYNSISDTDSVYVATPDSSTLTLTQSTGGTVSADPAAEKRQAGDQSTITAADTGHYHFVAWLGDLADSAGNPLTYTYPSSGTYTGSALFGLDSFGLAYTITGGNAIVTYLGGDSLAPYNTNKTCTLTVSTGYTADWPGGHVGAGKHPLTVVMTKDSTLDITTHALPVYTVDTTWGAYLSAWTVSGGLSHDSGTTISMSATCEACSSFTGYTGDYTGSNRSASFVITGNMAIGAGCEYGTCASGNERSLFGFLRSFRFGWR